MQNLKEIWEDYKPWLIGVPLVIVVLYVSGGIYRVSTGGDFFPKESVDDREARLLRCREVANTTPTFSQRMDGEDAGVCSGFSDTDISY